MKILFALTFMLVLADHAYSNQPANLKECIVELDEFLSPEEEEAFLEYPETSILAAYDLSLGNYIRNTWLFDEDSPLYTYFTDMCVQTPHQMSTIIMVTYHRAKTGKFIHLDSQIEELIGEKAHRKCKGEVDPEFE